MNDGNATDDNNIGGNSEMENVGSGTNLNLREEAFKFSFSNWHPLVKRHCFPCRIIELPSDFVDYIINSNNSHGLRLPASLERQQNKSHFIGCQLEEESEVGYQSLSDNESDNDNDNGSDGAERIPEFEEVQNLMSEALDFVGGKAFLTGNWCSPSDATWLLGSINCSACVSVLDAFLLLTGSSRIATDLQLLRNSANASKPAGNNDDNSTSPPPPPSESSSVPRAVCVFRKWFDLDPSMEFRVFFYKKQIVGISQRKASVFYPFLKEFIPEIKADIVRFSSKVVFPAFSDKLELTHYVIDVYARKRETPKNYPEDGFHSNYRIWIVNAGMFAQDEINPLLFSFQELLQIIRNIDANCNSNSNSNSNANSNANSEADPNANSNSTSNLKGRQVEMRVVEDEDSVLTSLSMENVAHGIPFDLLHMQLSGENKDQFESMIQNIQTETKKQQHNPPVTSQPKARKEEGVAKEKEREKERETETEKEKENGNN